jgi:hypothetical protein
MFIYVYIYKYKKKANKNKKRRSSRYASKPDVKRSFAGKVDSSDFLNHSIFFFGKKGIKYSVISTFFFLFSFSCIGYFYFLKKNQN